MTSQEICNALYHGFLILGSLFIVYRLSLSVKQWIKEEQENMKDNDEE